MQMQQQSQHLALTMPNPEVLLHRDGLVASKQRHELLFFRSALLAEVRSDMTQQGR